jgi:hypothetical protein
LGNLWSIAGIGVVARAQDSPQARGDADEKQEIAQVQAIANKAGLGPFSLTRTENFLCLGDAPVLFCETALRKCESLAEAFLSYFRGRGFKLDMPQHRSTVIALKDDASYAAYIGEAPGDEVGGQYDLDTNRLVIFDFRPRRAELAADPERVNLFTLVHETTHLLCFNTGLLSRKADVPACVSEGLATYVELWRPAPDRKAKIGAKNRPRLDALIGARNNAERWIPIADILANDDLVQNEKTGQLAYAESWLLVDFLFKNSAMLTKFKAYLAELPTDAGATKRLTYAEARLGSLKTLNHDVNRHAQRVIRQG